TKSTALLLFSFGHSGLIRHSSFVLCHCSCQQDFFDFMFQMAQTQLTWYGQSGFKIATPGGKTLLIDPWLTNPVFEKGKETLAALKNVELILLSHGHSDHVGNAVEIVRKTGAKLVANFDL